MVLEVRFDFETGTAVAHGGTAGLVPPLPTSTFKGDVVVISMTCTAGNSSNTITLVPSGPTEPLGSGIGDPITPTSDSITINCGTGGAAPTPTNTPPGATATPTNTVPDGQVTATPTNTVPGGATATPTNTQPVQPPTATRTNTPDGATATPPQELGDVNCNGQTNSIDASLVLQFDADLITTLACMDVADVNGDGLINAIDALYILWIDAGIYP